MTSIHGHQVLNMMLESEASYSEKNLEQAIIAKFGEPARFHICSAQGMIAKERVLFLAPGAGSLFRSRMGLQRMTVKFTAINNGGNGKNHDRHNN